MPVDEFVSYADISAEEICGKDRLVKGMTVNDLPQTSRLLAELHVVLRSEPAAIVLSTSGLDPSGIKTVHRNAARSGTAILSMVDSLEEYSGLVEFDELYECT